MRLLGLDVGDKRIGLAVSDELGLTAQGIGTLTRGRQSDDVGKLAGIIREYSVAAIVVGLPRNMNGTYGPQAEKVRDFVAALTSELPVEVIYWDERLTTASARRTLLEGDVSRKKRKDVIDKLAAVMILQGYLQYRAGTS